MLPVDSSLSNIVSNYPISIDAARHEKIGTFKAPSTKMPLISTYNMQSVSVCSAQFSQSQLFP